MRGRTYRFKRDQPNRRYRGGGVPFTPVEPGYRYFKLSFVEDPWLEVETRSHPYGLSHDDSIQQRSERQTQTPTVSNGASLTCGRDETTSRQVRELHTGDNIEGENQFGAPDDGKRSMPDHS